ncbi:hypothetical protein BC833DRAFT_531828, partial [Globomyces pollinis-pini]
RSIGVITIVMDQTGAVFMFSLYNYAKNLDVKAEDVLQVGMVIIVKEPYCKLTKGGGFMIRCDSLSDIIVVHQHDENFVRFSC